MVELEQLKSEFDPMEILFVADAMTGQDAVKSAEQFHQRLGITGVDPDENGWRRARRRGAVDPASDRPAAEVCRRRRKAERLRAVLPRARRLAHSGHGRHALVHREGRRRPSTRSKRSRCTRRSSTTISRWKISASNCARSRSWGRWNRFLGMLPQIGSVQTVAGRAKVDPKELDRVEAIINSMTMRERDNFQLINGSRRRRIARGSGTSVQQVNQLFKQYRQARQMMRTLSGGFKKGKKRKGLGGLNLEALMRQ